MLSYEQFYNWYNNSYSNEILYRVYRGGFLIGMGFYDGVVMKTLESSIYILKNVTFIKKQCRASSFRFSCNDRIDETYTLAPVDTADIGLISSAIQLVSNTLGHDEGYNKEYGLEMINNYARVLEELSVKEIMLRSPLFAKAK